jgi:hypothetical protein
MKKLLAALTLSTIFAAPASFAQSAAPSTAAAADPSSVAAAHEFFDAMNFRNVAKGMMAQMSQAMPGAVAQGAAASIDNNPKLSAAQKKAAHDKLNQEMPKLASMMQEIFSDPAIIDDMVRETEALYARHFTAAELNEMAAFYRTPVGTKMLTLMPQLMSESMQIGQRVVMPRVQALAQKLQLQ